MVWKQKQGTGEILLPVDVDETPSDSVPTRRRLRAELFLHGYGIAATAGAKYARSFQMRNTSGLTDYYLFYATNNPLGLRKMKEAMWRVDETGEFTFSDATNPNQLILIGREPRFDVLAKQLNDHFRGREIALSEIEEFVLAETPFRETHYKRVLKALELSDPPGLELLAGPYGRKRGTFPSPSMRLRSLSETITPSRGSFGQF